VLLGWMYLSSEEDEEWRGKDTEAILKVDKATGVRGSRADLATRSRFIVHKRAQDDSN